MTDAVPATKPKLKTSNPSNDEKAYGFWIYLLSDAIIFALLFAT